MLTGEHAAIARMLTLVERRAGGVDTAITMLHQHTGSAHVIGVTGPAGSGKSTLVAALTAHYRGEGRSVGVLAVDPSSVLSGGALLGDRIRMSALAGDNGVYIRSLATRGALGGLSRATLDAITVLDAAGKDAVILETVGAGQAEVDVVGAAHTVAVVSVPGMGDEVQANKASLLEIADVHVVNKSDRAGAAKTVAELRATIRLSHSRAGQWNVPVQQTVALDRGRRGRTGHPPHRASGLDDHAWRAWPTGPSQQRSPDSLDGPAAGRRPVAAWLAGIRTCA